MILTSPRRMLLHQAGSGQDPLTDNLANRRMLVSWIAAVSNQIENHMNRTLLIGDEVEYFDVLFGKTEYFVKRVPVISVSKVEIDPLGMWDAANLPAQLPYNHPGAGDRSVCIQHPLLFPSPAKKAIRITYNGGMANSSVISGYTMTQVTSAYAAGQYIFGQSSGSVGLVVSYTALTKLLVIENYYGQFQTGETILAYDDEQQSVPLRVTDTISAIYSPSLCDMAPEVVTACEMQVRYNYTHQKDFENSSTGKDGTTQRFRLNAFESSPLLPEVIHMLNPYVRDYV